MGWALSGLLRALAGLDQEWAAGVRGGDRARAVAALRWPKLRAVSLRYSIALYVLQRRWIAAPMW